jgi:hypothetical protein
MKPKLIALYSPVPQSGKTTVAEILEGNGYKTVSFAKPLKDMVVRFLMGFGYSKGDAERVIKDKDFVIGEIDLRVRDVMQLLGTDWGRKTIHKDVWIKMWEARQRLFSHVVADDLRFPNEYEAIRRRGGIIVKIESRRALRSKKESHESEGLLDNFDFNCVITNNGSLDELRKKALLLIE